MKLNNYIELIKLSIRLFKNGQVSLKKIVNFLHNGYSSIFRMAKAGKLPSAIIIEPVNYCNIRCTGCGFELCGQIQKKQKLSMECFVKIFDEVKDYIFFLVLENGGEPFLNRDLLRMIKYAYDNKVPTITSTNADFKTGDRWGEEVIESYLDTLIVSVSGHDNESHSIYHKNGNFNRVMGSAKKIISAKRKLRKSHPDLILRFIQTKDNKESVNIIERQYRDLGFDKLDVRKTATEHLIYKRSPDDKVKILTVGGDNTIYPNFCADLYFIPDVLVDGTVAPCCFTYLFPPNMGNVFDDHGMKNVWNNNNYAEMRKKVANNRMNIPACSVCNGSFGYSGENWNRSSKIEIYTPYHKPTKGPQPQGTTATISK